MKPLDPVTLVAAIAIAAFAIDRTVTAVLFLLSYRWKPADPTSLEGPARWHAERSYKLVYVTLASLLALTVYVLGNLSIFAALGFPRHPVLDAFVTTLVLVGGSDRVAALLKMPEAGRISKSPAEPIQISGTVTLVSDTEQTPPCGKKTGLGA